MGSVFFDRENESSENRFYMDVNDIDREETGTSFVEKADPVEPANRGKGESEWRKNSPAKKGLGLKLFQKKRKRSSFDEELDEVEDPADENDCQNEDQAAEKGNAATQLARKVLTGIVKKGMEAAGAAQADPDAEAQGEAGEAAADPGMGMIPRRCRISMLGPSGSGKSVFLSGVYQDFVLTAENGFSLRLDPSQNFTGYYSSMEDVAIYNGYQIKDSFPSGTENSSIYNMQLMNGSQVLCGFDFIDYKGGLLRNVSNPETIDADAKFVKDHITDSDVIFMFLDAVKLSNFTTEECHLHCNSDAMSQIYLDLVRENNRKYHVVVLLSKADDTCIDRKDKANEYENLVQKADELMGTVKTHSKSFLILPVSGVGEDRTITTESRTAEGVPTWHSELIPGRIPDPMNIDLAILYACGKILGDRERQLTEENRSKGQIPDQNTRYLSRKAKAEAENKHQQMQRTSEEISDLKESIEKIKEAKGDDWVSYILDREGNG